MKTFSIHSVRNLLAVVIALGLGYAAYMVNPSTVVPTKVEASSSDNVSGFAWSENIGWISLNNTSDGSATSYGVNISPLTGTGIFSGTAWSENIGWISFDRSVTGPPPSAPFVAGTPIAQVDWATGSVTGWARALSGCEMTAGTPATTCVPTPETIAGAASGGWDGWIRFSDAGNSFWVGNGVKIDAGGKFSGYAWGSDVVGWIDFAPLVNGVTPLAAPAKVAVPCTSSNPTFTPTTGCDATASCVSGGTKTQTNLTGVLYGTCTDGSTGTASQSCTALTTTCSAGTGTAGTFSWFVADGSCIAGTGENSTNSLSDCKPKTRFWQF